jgi:hypothetical protein
MDNSECNGSSSSGSNACAEVGAVEYAAQKGLKDEASRSRGFGESTVAALNTITSNRIWVNSTICTGRLHRVRGTE